MPKQIIFDFNRTLYQPELGQLVPKSKTVLKKLKKRGYTLFLVARAVPGRKQLMKSLGITQYFSKVITTPRKSKALFKKLASKKSKDCTVVGDRTRNEIAIGNSLGMTTIWLNQGKFKTEKPRNKKEKPSYTIYRLSRLLTLLG